LNCDAFQSYLYRLAQLQLWKRYVNGATVFKSLKCAVKKNFTYYEMFGHLYFFGMDHAYYMILHADSGKTKTGMFLVI